MNNKSQGLPPETLTALEKRRQYLEVQLEQTRNENRQHTENNGKAWKDSFDEHTHITKTAILEEIANINSTIANASIRTRSYRYLPWEKPLVKIGDTVTIQYDDDSELQTYYIAGEKDSYVQQNIISCNTPLGRCLLEPHANNKRTYIVNNTKYTITIIKVN